MPTYVAFLRAINLGAVRKFPRDDLRAVVAATGASDVDTYLNTGNLRLTLGARSTARVESLLEAAFLADRGFAVPTIVMTPAELVEIVATATSYAHDGRHYVELLREPPDAELISQLELPHPGSPERTVRVVGRAIHLMGPADAAFGVTGLLSPALVRRLGVTTNRNLTVVRELAQRWST